MNLETIKLENQGLQKKTSFYLKITSGNLEHTMNIGEATFNKINEIKSKENAEQPGHAVDGKNGKGGR